MTEPGNAGSAVAGPPEGSDAAARIDALRAQGAERFDPVGFRFIEALARRATVRQIETRAVLGCKIAASITEFGERFDHARHEAGAALARGTARFPHAAETLRARYESGDFGGLHRLLARLEARAGTGPLAELLAHVRRHAPQGDGGATAGAAAGTAPQGELKSLSYFRNTWSRLSVDRQLAHAIAVAPENAGPLNSHFLVLQALKLMRDISPAYLEQFVSYADALLWLDQMDASRGTARKGAGRNERDKKRKPGDARP